MVNLSTRRALHHWAGLEGLIHPNLSLEILSLAIESTWITFFYAVAGMSLAIVLAFVLGILASGILNDHLSMRAFSKGIFRVVLGFLRAIHELVWALIFVATFGL